MEKNAKTLPFLCTEDPAAGLDHEAERLMAPWHAMPAEAARLSCVLRSDPLDLKLLSEAAQAAPKLAAQVVKLSNASLFNLQQPVSTIAQAAMAIRSELLRTLVLTCHLVDRIAHSIPAREARAFWHHSLLTAAFSQQISQWTSCADPELAYFAGLLHDLGWIPLLTESGAAAHTSDQGSHGRAAVFEDQERPDQNRHCALGGRLGRLWGFPEPLVEVFEFHHEPGRAPAFPELAAVVAAADACAWIEFSKDLGAADVNSPIESVLRDLNPGIRLRLARVFEAEFQRVDGWLNYGTPCGD